MMPSVRCSACGQSNLQQAKFCDQCASPLNSGTQSHQLNQSWVIGSELDCDIVIQSPVVSGRHCCLTKTKDGFLIEDLGSTNGTYLNGQRITAKLQVAFQAPLMLGSSVQFPWGRIPVNPRTSVDAPSRIINIGRDSDNDVVLDYPMISGHHARILLAEDSTIFIEDLHSTNGVALGRPEEKIKKARLSPQDTVYFGSFRIAAAKLLQGKFSLGNQPYVTVSMPQDVMVFGRDPACDHVLDYPMISWRHAQFTKTYQGFQVEDLGSTNGTFVNGSRISGSCSVKAGDVIGLGSFTFKITPEGDIEKRNYQGNVTIETRGLTVDVPNRRLIENISLSIYPSEMVGLMGPSGAGKTTFMMALNGYTSPAYGNVLFNNLDLYANYEQFRGQLGYVPQEDIMHGELSVEQALYYTARLRLPSDYPDHLIQERIHQVLDQLKLTDTAKTLIGSPTKKGISGGQRKRVNLAMELLTEPPVLFLDEPTSGLSSEDTLTVMKILRKLADEGKTILLTIHQPSLEAFRLMDNLVMLSKDGGSQDPAQLVYYGPTFPDSIRFFNPNSRVESGQLSPEMVLKGLEAGMTKPRQQPGSTKEWVEKYRNSTLKQEYVDQRSGKQPPGTGNITQKVTRQFGIGQWWTLVRRCFSIKLKDTWNTLILMAQAPIIAILVVLIFGDHARYDMSSLENWVPASKAIMAVMFLLAISAIWLGCSNSAREIVGEWAIYHRERMVNLKIPSYVASKFTVLGGFCVLQCAMLLGIVYVGCQLKGSFLGMLAILILVSWVGLAFGLLISALAKTSEVAIGLVPLVMIPMVIMGGILLPTHKMNQGMKICAQIMASRWAFEGLALIENKERPKSPSPPSPSSHPSSAAASAQPTKGDLQQSEMAGDCFPTDERKGTETSVEILIGLLTVLVLTILGILKSRDIH